MNKCQMFTFFCIIYYYLSFILFLFPRLAFLIREHSETFVFLGQLSWDKIVSLSSSHVGGFRILRRSFIKKVMAIGHGLSCIWPTMHGLPSSLVGWPWLASAAIAGPPLMVAIGWRCWPMAGRRILADDAGSSQIRSRLETLLVATLA